MTAREPFTLDEAVRICHYIGGDGHSILSLDFVDAMGGVPLAKIAPLARSHVSDFGNHKETIYDPASGCVIGSLQGVYTLDLLNAIKRDLCLTTESYFGRGRQAQAIVDSVRALYESYGKSWPDPECG